MRRMQNDYDGLSERNSDDGGRTWKPFREARNLSANQRRAADHHRHHLRTEMCSSSDQTQICLLEND